MNLRRIGEDRLLEQLLPSLTIGEGVVAGAGDDSAIVRSPGRGKLMVLKTDCVVERIHFEPETDPVAVGWKAMMRPLSDFAAVSALPKFALVTLILPATKTIAWVRRVYKGLNSAAERFTVSIVGGETSNSDRTTALSITVAGFVEPNRWVSRRGGIPGDDLFVTGKLGGSRRGKHLQFVPRVDESRWLTKKFSIHAMMDLSDGLGADLPRLAKASSVGFNIETDNLPLMPGATVENAISDGEDYELLFAISPRDRRRLQRGWQKKFPDVRLTRIGNLTSTGKGRTLLRGGYVHFK